MKPTVATMAAMLAAMGTMDFATFSAQAYQTPEDFLTDLAVAYRVPDQYFIADAVAPKITVKSMQFAYRTWNTVAQKILRSNLHVGNHLGGETKDSIVDWSAGKTTGLTIGKLNHAEISDDDVKMFGQDGAKNEATMAVRAQMLLQREYRVVTALQTIANYASSAYYTTLSGTNQWSDFSNSDPERDIKSYITTILKGASVKANTIIIPWEVAEPLSRHPAVKDIAGGDTKGLNSDAFLGGDLMGLPPNLWGLRPIVPMVSYVNSNEGQTEVNAFLWGKHVSIMHVPTSPRDGVPAFMYTFESEALKIFSAAFVRPEGGQFVAGTEHNVEAIVANRAAALIKSAVA